MIQSGPQVPRFVTLPDDPLIAAWHLRACLGQSRQVLHLWRTNHRFPASHREGWTRFTSTAAVADWLVARGGEVTLR